MSDKEQCKTKREIKNEKKRQYYRKNREKLIAISKLWHSKHKEKMKEYRDKNREKIKQRIKQRIKEDPERNKEQRKKWYRARRERNLEKMTEYQRTYKKKEWRTNEEFRTKSLCRIKSYRLEASGEIKRKPCEVCGDYAQRHHNNYDDPRDITWLCETHHQEHHVKLREVT